MMPLFDLCLELGSWILSDVTICCRDTLSIEVDDLRDQHRILNEDLSSAQVRWHTAREVKVKSSNILERFQKSEDELVLLAEEKEQLIVEKKVGTHCFLLYAISVS